MLVLTRKIGETIVVDNDIRITVVAVSGDRVRLGITAPASVCVDREEVHKRRLEFQQVPRRSKPARPVTPPSDEPHFVTTEVKR
jgi:carbon storage regulator